MENKRYTLDNGDECSRSAFIRQEFEKGKSRKEIAETLDVAYYAVYSATANMHNAAHPEGASRVVTNVAAVNANFEFVNAEGEVVATAEEAAPVSRNDLMKDLYAAGKTRAQLKDYFDVQYATVYQATKDTESPNGSVRSTKMVIHPESGVEVSRADYIRELYEKGMNRRAIAEAVTKLTGELCDYAVVWTATKPKKAEEGSDEVATEAVE